MTVQLLGLDPSTYQSHPLHSSERIWTETNCYVDLWIEVLHALGQEPLASCAFVLSADFACDQWTFIKFPTEDLRELYGIDVNEMADRPSLEKLCLETIARIWAIGVKAGMAECVPVG